MFTQTVTLLVFWSVVLFADRQRRHDIIEERLGNSGRVSVPMTENDLFFTQLHSYTLLPNGSFTSRMHPPGEALPPFQMFLHFDTRFVNEVNDGRRGRWTWVYTDQDGQLVLDEFGNPELVDSGTRVTGEWLGIPGDQSGYELNPSGNRYWNRIGQIDQIQIVSWSDDGFFDEVAANGISDPRFTNFSTEFEGIIEAPVGGGSSGRNPAELNGGEPEVRNISLNRSRSVKAVSDPLPSTAVCET